MSFLPSDVASATAVGFTLVPNTTSLLANTAYPGFLFKIVDSLSAANACGGIFLFDSANAWEVAYLGLTSAWATFRPERLGNITVPDETTLSPGPRRAGLLTASGDDSWFFADLLALVTARAQKSLIQSGRFLAVISRADRGCVIRCRANMAMTPVRPPEVWEGIISSMNYSHPDKRWQTTQQAIAGRDLDSGRFVTYYVPKVGGFIEFGWAQDKKAFLSRARTHFLSTFDSEDAAVKAAYTDAYDSVAASVSGEVFDGVHLSVYEDASGRVALAAQRPPSHVHVGTVDALMAFDTRWWANPNPRPAPYDTRSAATRTTTILGNVSGTHTDGSPMIRCATHLTVYVGGYSDSTKCPQPLVGGADVRVSAMAAHTDSWTLAAVPFADVRMDETNVLKASDCIGPISPRALPAAGTLSTLDLRERVKTDLDAVSAASGGSASFSSSQIEADKLAEISAAQTTESAREAMVTRTLPYLLPYSRFIVDFVNRVDAVVKNAQ